MCSCGKVIAHAKADKASETDKSQSVFDRLNQGRVTKEMNQRKLAAKQIEKEARDCTYIPLTNSVRRQMKGTSSLGNMVARERRVENARQQFNAGKICVECLKKVEIGTGTYLLEDVVSSFAWFMGAYEPAPN